ncbi:MAG: tRNA dihydrouridine synthase DusB [Clostridia bacterium]|nr:tRNA dihydrouridine synthase DusB [Clostridia bacterium]
MPVLLAPMAGITDSAFRRLCIERGCDFTFTEMVSANGLHYKNRKTQELISISEAEKRCGIQLFGHDPEIIAETVERLFEGLVSTEEVSIVDINMGCPAPKITSNGDGSALMKSPALAGRIIEAAVKASPVPVSVKFRKGWDESSVNAVEFARIAENSGAAFITVHGRTRMQMYSGKADRELIKAVVDAVKIPVVGNGDIFSGESALDMLEKTGCAALMVARGAQGDPFIFSEIRAALSGEGYAPPSEEARLDTAMRHIKEYVSEHGGGAFVDMRKHIAWYTKGMYGSNELRRRVNTCSNAEELMGLIRAFRDEREGFIKA